MPFKCMYHLKNHLKMNTLYLHPNQGIAGTSEAHCVPFPYPQPLPGPLFQPSAFFLLFSPDDLTCMVGTRELWNLKLLPHPQQLPPRAASRGCQPKLGSSLLLDPGLWTIQGTGSSSKKRGSPASEHGSLPLCLQVDQGWKSLGCF